MPRLPGTSPQTLGVLAVLLAAPHEWHYGYDISRRTRLKSGTLYPILMRLADRGWLETDWAASEWPGRPPRHTYRLTAQGTRAATALLASAPAGRERRQALRPSRGGAVG